MKTLICDPDLRREALCSECRKKLEQGKLSMLEIEVSRKLYRLNKKFFFLDLELKGVVELNDEVVVLLCTGKLGQIIGRGGRTIAELGKELGKKCRVIEKGSDKKKMVQDLAGDNVRVIGINKIFNMGNLEYSVVINREDETKLISSRENLEKGLEKILGSKTRIEFGG